MRIICVCASIPKEELAHYSNGTSDIEYDFGAPIGWGELWGIADRTDYDLKAHMETSKQSLEYFDQESGEKFVPYCIEPSVGCRADDASAPDG